MKTDAAHLKITDLTVRYGPVTALDSVSMTVAAGAVTAVLGANGAGKTTLLRTISGLLKPVSGRIELAGADIVGVAPDRMSRKGLAHVPEGRGVIAELTVDENLRLGAMGRNRSHDAVTLDRIYDMFPPLTGRRTSSAHTLSGGERQMLVIGRALMATPSVLLLDEPSLGLAPKVAAQIFETLRGLVDSESMTVVLVEQNARSALSIAEHAVVLDLGKVAVEGPADTLAGDDALRHAYLGF
ncbi:ABC transporter ATP-binding protein [Rhodococcus sp. IEGM 1401]|jgi:branched-chain amino acid transport system ATP-binding protein|uniref:ABC transporter ATP-binding protein n=1 Tax=unclassified Rhodococcus (in: high G+C Gram-positive bacteria) TaxID=192944 RepID=UPI0007BC316E|nr:MULTISPECIES: ABC transporter ATP-binding protein [unclassified Rhodococcus (in: high G+C Gram-positive bacteria)]KZF07239.1 ABC transporter ATP-binding protein [Rhodococcus sp. EPR-147]KZF07820.1 ABC transporter ATP-binding protein [Rhodococcus sp. EPR-279]MCZ4560815.1 ABC transporter ATP-binding protein [Rhodococcus sp. IEGM 1401]MDI6630295.1 ABC transporter ATP-binding protein [Rhodococcus sp. (in: high G+C Gram-positive bacteria)]MDI9920955.1 ABC transporter ATP-binding protein [Rhodoco